MKIEKKNFVIYDRMFYFRLIFNWKEKNFKINDDNNHNNGAFVICQGED
jgi:hypothetical protein